MTGPTGPTGATGPNVTATSGFAVNTSGATITVVAAGTAIPFPTRLLSSDITVDGSNTIFTVNTAGRYRLSYEVNVTLGVAMGTRLIINSAANLASTIVPLVTLSNYSNEIILDLTAGSTVTLQAYGLAASISLLTGGAGAALMIMRLS